MLPSRQKEIDDYKVITRKNLIFNFVESRLGDYDIQRIRRDEGTLENYYPFQYFYDIGEEDKEYTEEEIKIVFTRFIIYQREVIYDLDDKKVNFYYNLMEKIKNTEMANMSNFVEFPMSGFLFYRGKYDKVKTLLFNER